MPEHLRALVVILFVAALVFAAAKKAACAYAIAEPDFRRRRNAWFGVTLSAFLAHNFWLYSFAAGVVAFLAQRKESSRFSLFVFLMLALPVISAPLPGLGLADHLFELNHLRLLSLVILLPAFLSLRKSEAQRFGASWPDRLIAAYLVLSLLLMLRTLTFTNAVRQGLFYGFIDVFLPYYVASRSLKSEANFRDAIMSFSVGALVLAAIGVFEYLRFWLLYVPLEDAFGLRSALGAYLGRGQNLRAMGTTGQPIVLGYVMAVAAGLLLSLKPFVPGRWTWAAAMVLILGGLFASLSRGPWVGAAAIFLLFVALRPNAVKRLAVLGAAGVIAVPVVLASPIGPKVMDYLPFVGSVDAENVTYRQRLLEVSLMLMREHPYFGMQNYLSNPAMEELRQGQGIIDVVNSYIAVGLGSGIVGLSLFAGFFASIVLGILLALRRARGDDERHRLGCALAATLAAILIIIATVSSIKFIPAIYWTIAGMCVAYARLVGGSPAPSAYEAGAFSAREAT